MTVNTLFKAVSKKGRPVNTGRFFVIAIGLFCVSFAAVAADASLEQRLKRLERILDNQELMQMYGSLQSLQREVSELRGDVEVLSFELNKLKKQQKDIYLDLDQRIQQTDKALADLQAAPTAVGVLNAESSTDDATDDIEETLGEQESYQAALSILKSGRYEDAIQAFQVFLINYPQSGFAANAQYWMAEAYYVLKDFQAAVTQFQKVISAYPDSRKVSDAYLKIGFSYYEMKEWSKAQEALEKVITDYADSTAARLAQRRLQKMKLQGNI